MLVLLMMSVIPLSYTCRELCKKTCHVRALLYFCLVHLKWSTRT